VGERYLRKMVFTRETQYERDGTIFGSNYVAPVMGSFDNLNTEFDDYKEDLVLEDIEEVEVETNLNNRKRNLCRLF